MQPTIAYQWSNFLQYAYCLVLDKECALEVNAPNETLRNKDIAH
jgi:hypothetical protein